MGFYVQTGSLIECCRRIPGDCPRARPHHSVEIRSTTAGARCGAIGLHADRGAVLLCPERINWIGARGGTSGQPARAHTDDPHESSNGEQRHGIR
jgi:hypothetical protein